MRFLALILFLALTVLELAIAQIPEMSITISKDDSTDLFTRDIFSNELISANVTFHGKLWKDVGLRFKGHSHRYFPKKSFLIKFPTNDPFFGVRQINLHSLYTDKSFVREKLSWMIFDDLQALAPQGEYVWLMFNNYPKGLYLIVDKIDTYFLERKGRVPSSLYVVDDEYSLGDLTEQPEDLLKLYYSKQVGDDDKYDDLKELLHALNTISDSSFEREVNTLFDMNSVYNWLTGNILMMMGDSYNKNYYLYHDVSRTPNQWTIIPWDYDMSFGMSGDPGIPYPTSLLSEGFGYTFPPLMGPHNVLKDRLWNTPSMREHLKQRIDTVLQTRFTEERMHKRIDSLAAAVRSDVERDPEKWGTVQDFADHVEALKYYVTARRLYLLNTFVHKPTGTFNIATISVSTCQIPYHFIDVDGRDLATMTFTEIHGLDSVRISVHPFSFPPDMGSTDSGKVLKRWMQVTAFPPQATFSASVRWVYHDISSLDREVPKGVVDERSLCSFWFNGDRWEELPSTINPISNTVVVHSINQQHCRNGTYFAIKRP